MMTGDSRFLDKEDVLGFGVSSDTLVVSILDSLG